MSVRGLPSDEQELYKAASTDLALLRDKFPITNRADNDILLQWFKDVAHFSTQLQAQIAGVSTETIRQWRKRLGIRSTAKHKFAKKAKYTQPPAVVIPPPPPGVSWRDPEWFIPTCRAYGVTAISRAIGRHNRTVWSRAKRLGCLSTRPANKYRNKTWCYRQYIQRGLSSHKCAKLAGVCTETFLNWLNKFEIPVRSTHKQQCGIHPLWATDLRHSLKQQKDIVNKVFIRENHLHVRFHTFMWESYYLNEQPPWCDRKFGFHCDMYKGRFRKRIPIYREFEDAFGTQSYPHWIVKRRDWNAASFIERRMAIQELVKDVTYGYRYNGWAWPKYPASVIEREYQRLCDMDTKGLIANGIMRPATSRTTWRRLFEHFVDLEPEYTQLVSRPFRCWRALRWVAKRRCKLNLHNLYRANSLLGFGPKIQNPMSWVTLFRVLRPKSVLDLSPGLCSKAIACGIAGVKYVSEPNEKFEKAVAHGMADTIKLDHEPFTGEVADLAIMDNNFSKCDIEKAMTYAHVAKRLMVFVHNQDIGRLQDTYQPTSIIRLKQHPNMRQFDALFIF